MRINILLFFLINGILFSQGSSAQVSISGATCVVSGGEVGYLYTATGNQTDQDILTWKVTGGTVVGTGTSTASGSVIATGSSLRIIWNKGISAGKIKLTNARLGESELSVKVIGFTNSISIPNTVIRIGSTVNITGTGPSSSACTALSNYWWEVASSAIGPFENIEGATDKNLTVVASQGKKYYRRILSVNGDVLYSNIISIDPQ